MKAHLKHSFEELIPEIKDYTFNVEIMPNKESNN